MRNRQKSGANDITKAENGPHELSKVKMVIKELPWKRANQYLARTNALQNAVVNRPPHSTALQGGTQITKKLL